MQIRQKSKTLLKAKMYIQKFFYVIDMCFIVKNDYEEREKNGEDI